MTAVEQLIDEFNEELKVAIEIGNEDKIRIIKHLITIAISYLPMENEQKIEFACKVVKVSADKYIQGKTTEQIAKELLTFKSE